MFNRIKTTFARFSHDTVSMLLLFALLFLRIPYLTTFVILLPSSPPWLYFSFAIGTYGLTAILIYWERQRLQAFWIDLAGALVFLCQPLTFLVGIGLFVKMRTQKTRFPAPPLSLARWALTGALLAILVQIYVVQPNSTVVQERAVQAAPTLGYLFSAVLTQMLNAAVWEEPLFRGFLWGYLRLARWKNVWIWLFQAALFTFSHAYYLQTEPFGPWLIRMLIPSLLLGWIAWRAKSIAASMITHGFLNATGDLLTHFGTPESALTITWTAAGIMLAALLIVIPVELYLHRRIAKNRPTLAY